VEAVPLDRHQNRLRSGSPDHWNPPARPSLPYRDTDVDFLWLGEGDSRVRGGPQDAASGRARG
jgi:hypothetical protein